MHGHIMNTGPEGAVFPQPASFIEIANKLRSVAAVKTQETHNRLQNTSALFLPYMGNMDIHHQRHRFIDVPRVVQAREGLATANNLLNIARARLNNVMSYANWNLDDVIQQTLSIHYVLHRADLENQHNLHLFRLIDGPNNHQTRAVFRNTFSGSESQSNSRR